MKAFKRLLHPRRQRSAPGVIHTRRGPASTYPVDAEKIPVAINHLPPEILSVIFLHVLPPFGGWEDPGRTPKVLGQVCQLWRALTLALPGLWASLNITCDHYILRPQLHTIHTHLQRSAAHSLSIVLNTYNSDYPTAPPNPYFPAILAALVAARDRWRCVSIRLASEATRETLGAITQGGAPLLEMFCCEIEGDMLSELPPIPLRALQGCSRLESLTWYCVRAPVSPALGDEVWAQLTMLRLEASLAASDCLTLLRLSPRLSTVEFQEINSAGTIPSRHLLHVTLHTLQAAGAYTLTLISALALPALADLHLDVSPTSRRGADDPVLPAFFTRSAPPLRSLSIANLHLPGLALLRVLELAPGLRSLSATESGPSCVPFTAALIDALHPSLSPSSSLAGGPLCPRLGTLRLSGPLEAPDGACAAMLRARWGAAARANGVACLREVHVALVVEGDMHIGDDMEMWRLSQEGMAATFSRSSRR